MSGKTIRLFVAAALLALVMLVNTPIVAAPLLSQAANSTATLAMEHSTTGS
jgi:hypothetical protein